MYGTAYRSLSLLPLQSTHLKTNWINTGQELKYDWEAELSGTGSRSRVEFGVFRVLPFYILNNDMATTNTITHIEVGPAKSRNP